jgi:hypothetical protein
MHVATDFIATETSGTSFINKITYIKVTDLINVLPGNSSVNTAQHSTIEDAVFPVDPTDAPIDWLDSDHVICVHCRAMSVPRLYKYSDRIRSGQLRVAVATEAGEQASSKLKEYRREQEVSL